MSLKVFYIEDDLDLLEVFEENFSSDRIQIETFSDATRALDRIQFSKPDLVILDYRLTKTTGDVVAKMMDTSIAKIMITGDLAINNEGHFEKIFYKPYDLKEIEEYLISFGKKVGRL